MCEAWLEKRRDTEFTDSMVSIFEVALAPSTVTFTDSAGLTLPASLYFVSPGQVNAVVPAGLKAGPATGQVFLELFGTGIRGRNALTDVTVSVGGILVAPQYAGPQPQYPGMDQVNILLPPALAGRGAVAIDLSVAGQHANAVAINVK
jgi:hypothetical protein